jgi:branched-chain amino acid transport system substrate-binding protein
MSQDANTLSRRRFLGNAALFGTAIATGVGSWVIPTGWANAAAGPIKVGVGTDLTGPMGYAGNADANVARMVIKDINDAGACWAGRWNCISRTLRPMNPSRSAMSVS